MLFYIAVGLLGVLGIVCIIHELVSTPSPIKRIKEEEVNKRLGKECPMRIEGGSCFAAGRLCAEVDRPTCEGLRDAYNMGHYDGQNIQQARRNERHEFHFPDGSYLEIIGPPDGPCKITYVKAEEKDERGEEDD